MSKAGDLRLHPFSALQLIAASLISFLHIVRGKYAGRIHHDDNTDASCHQRSG